MYAMDSSFLDSELYDSYNLSKNQSYCFGESLCKKRIYLRVKK
jgi:hypothetical protein